MRSVPFDFEGSTYALSFTAEALFEFQEKYGDTTDLIGETRAMENTVEGWKGCCWLGALLARQGELQRRYMGETPQPMLSAEELRRKASPRDMLRLRKAIQEALLQGFSRAVDEDEDEEVDAVLAERERAEKKNESAGALRARWLGLGARVLGLSVREILLLTPGTFWDMVTAVSPKRKKQTEEWKDEDD